MRGFLTKRNTARKRPCPPGTFYCFRCRAPKRPAEAMVDYVPRTPITGNLIGLCETCGTAMHRRARKAAIPDVMPGIAVAVREDHERPSGRPSPSVDCDNDKDG